MPEFLYDKSETYKKGTVGINNLMNFASQRTLDQNESSIVILSSSQSVDILDYFSESFTHGGEC